MKVKGDTGGWAQEMGQGVTDTYGARGTDTHGA